MLPLMISRPDFVGCGPWLGTIGQFMSSGVAPGLAIGGGQRPQTRVLVIAAALDAVTNRFGRVLVLAEVGDQRALVLVEASRSEHQLGMVALQRPDQRLRRRPMVEVAADAISTRWPG